MKKMILAMAILAGLGLSSCIDEREPEGSNPGKSKPATTTTQDTMTRDNTGTMQSGGGTGNGGQ